MNQFARKCILLLMLLALVVSAAGCAASKPLGIMENGASQFSQGKDEEDYSLSNSGKLLDDLIDNYADAYRVPDGTQLDDDDLDDLIQQIEDEHKQETGQDHIDPEDVPVVHNYDELKEVVFQMQSKPTDSTHFILADGYTPDMVFNSMSNVLDDNQRRDPIVGGNIGWWSYSYQGNDYYLKVGYRFSMDELVRIRAEAKAAVKKVAAQLYKPGMSDYEAVCAVNDYLCDNVYYPPNEPYADITHSAYGAMIDGCAVCEGYACAASALLNEMGVQCDIEIGPCGSGYHAWNLVLVDGNWYQLDVTWNDGGGDRTTYLLVTDSFMRQSRDWDASRFPATPSNRYNP